MAKEANEAAGPLSKIPQPAKIAGAVVVLVCSVGLMLHRMPHRQYQAAHEDKPRPKAEAVASAAPAPKAAPAPAPAVAKAVPPAPVPVKPGAKAVVQVPEAPAPAPLAVVLTDDEWLEACRPEIGLLCHKMATKRAHRCLNKYDDVLLTSCREALGKRFPANRSVATTGF